MPDKPDPENPEDSYSEEETAKRRDATIRAMIAMRPRPHGQPKDRLAKSSRKRPKKATEHGA
jgi:hypothetical protein